ncbi:MAG: Rne/Rng family ribonuclease [Epulopiscium sp.]|nr:Rne/Rng family ribonuclease [Candidatus Epulonipiscium sp.]
MKEIIVDVGLQYIRTALLENDELIEFQIEEKEHQSVVGNIYRGLVQKVIPGIGAAFIDIGEDKNAYLSLAEKQPIFWEEGKELSMLKSGQAITVQAIKEGTATKGITVTTQISLPGKYFVFLSDRPDIHISKKIKQEKERKRLMMIVEQYKKPQYGVIIRTEAMEKIEEELLQDYLILQEKWLDILKRESFAMPKTIIHREMSSGLKNVREFFTDDVHAYKINDNELHQEVKQFVSQHIPTLVDKVEYVPEAEDLFVNYKIESKVKKALQPRVWLKSGGILIIEETEALTVIDVNSGKFIGKKNVEETILKTNLEAAVEIAKQVRLRNHSGIIIIDFIDMAEKDNQKKVLIALEKAFKKDPVPSRILGMTSLGLVEMTRKKRRNSLQEQLMESCNHCQRGKKYGKAFLVPKIEKEIQQLIHNTTAEEILLEGTEEVLSFFYDYKRRFLKPLKLKKNDLLFQDGYKVSAIFSPSSDSSLI